MSFRWRKCGAEVLLSSMLFVGHAVGTELAYRLDLGQVKDLPPGMTWVAEGPSGEPCLRVDVNETNHPDHYLLNIPIDLTHLRDHEILLSYDVKALTVRQPEQAHHGIKCQLHWTSETNGPRWFNDDQGAGSFPWRHSALLIRVDPDATKGELQLGLQESLGTVWLANISISVVRPRPEQKAQRFRGHDLPRLRGVVGPGSFEAKDMTALQSWNVNTLRWRLLNTDWARTDIPGNPEVYEPWLENKLNELEQVLQHAAKVGIRVLVDLHSPPGGRLPDGTLRMVLDPTLGDYFIDIWTRIAKRLAGHEGLWGYDLMNEPVQKRPSPPGVRDWWELQDAAARAVRAVDPHTPILIAADDWDSPPAFAWMRPVEVPRVIYTVHVYWPYEYTHQGLEGEWNEETALAYPGTFNGRPFDREAIARQLEPVRAFQEAYNAHIFVGEFSVVRWAPGAAEFLADSISLFEEYGWDWTYHAFRESGEWSLEHADLPHNPHHHVLASEPTERRKVIESWFSRNLHHTKHPN